LEHPSLSSNRAKVCKLLILSLIGPIQRTDPQVVRHPHEIRHRIGTHFTHDVSAMNLDRELGYVQFGRNLLIQQTRHHLLHDLLLTRGQRLVPAPQLTHLFVLLPGAPVAFDGFLNRP
jgi:hypothetical protein